MEKTKKMELQDEGSWALMIEESNVRAIQKYHGSMAGLEIEYYLSVGSNRWYKAYFDRETICSNRAKMSAFLLDDKKYNQCISEIYTVLEKMKNAKEQYQSMNLIGKFNLYCDLLCEYIAYYNSVIADTFYQNVYSMVDSNIPINLNFVSKQIKDSLFATDNNSLLSHMQNVDLVAITDKYLKNQSIDEDIKEYVKKYKSTTSSSGNPNGITEDEVLNHISKQTITDLKEERALLRNLHLRYTNSEAWAEMTACSLGFSDDTKLMIRRTSQLSYLKILMRECFQKFKIDTREDFLYKLIAEIGKSQFDYMMISEICSYIHKGERISEQKISERKSCVVFELRDNTIHCLKEIPTYVKIDDEFKRETLTGDVLIGTGVKRYKVRKIEQNEEGLSSFNEYIEREHNKQNVAVITNVLRPFLVPKLKKFGVLMTQYGGYTSHASVLCRELGIYSIISVDGLMDSLQTDDFIEIDFNNGIIKKVKDMQVNKSSFDKIAIDLNDEVWCDKSEVGNKAWNLMKINRIACIPKGFVLTKNTIRDIDNPYIQDEIMEKISSLKCNKLAIRSSHEGEDGDDSSCAGLFESFVNVDTGNKEEIVKNIKGGKLVLLINTDKKGKKQAHQMKFYQKYFTSCFNPRRILSRTRLGSTPSTSAISFIVIPR